MDNRKTKSMFSTFLSYLIPSMLSMALMAVYTFTDTFVVGQKLGFVALGAMGICTPIITITYVLGFLFGMGGGALYSIEMGKKNTKKANGIFFYIAADAVNIGSFSCDFRQHICRPVCKISRRR